MSDLEQNLLVFKIPSVKRIKLDQKKVDAIFGYLYYRNFFLTKMRL